MKENDVIVKRQKYSIRLKNEDMDFFLNMMLGMGEVVGLSHGEIFFAIHDIKDGDARDWREAFLKLSHHLLEDAQAIEHDQMTVAAGRAYFGAAHAIRAAIQYTDPTGGEYPQNVTAMETAFQSAVRCLNLPIRTICIPYNGKELPGYYLEQDRSSHPTLLMIGGGDTYREDLFAFAGYPGWKRGYNVVMVDLPGQGKTPASGLHFEVDASRPIAAILDWLEAQAAVLPQQIGIYGVSGGGYFSAQAAAVEPRIQAWVASTPIFDMARIFEREFGAVLRAPGWLLNGVLEIAGKVNASAELNLRKYAWQFGTPDFKAAMDGVRELAQVVDPAKISCPALFLMGQSEAPDLQRQTHELYDALTRRNHPVTLREFTPETGADTHCQVSNMRLAHQVIFDWLDGIFGHPCNPTTVDPRLLI